MSVSSRVPLGQNGTDPMGFCKGSVLQALCSWWGPGSNLPAEEDGWVSVGAKPGRDLLTPSLSSPWGWSLGWVLQPLFCQQASASTSPLGGTVGAVGGRTSLRPQAAEAGHPGF